MTRLRWFEGGVLLLVYPVCFWFLMQHFEPMTRGQEEPVRFGVIMGSMLLSLLASFVFVGVLRRVWNR